MPTRLVVRRSIGGSRGCATRRHRALGLAGDAKSVGTGVFELRVHTGPGYRVYFAWVGPKRVLLLGGGTKATQASDIVVARQRLNANRDEANH